MGDTKSCLVEKLSAYVELSDDDLFMLARFEEEEISFGPQSIVYNNGDRSDQLHVVRSGWLYSCTELPDGRRQIVRIHHPGDILGMPDIAFQHATLNVQSATNAVLCPFPRKHLDEVFKHSPRLTALLFTIALRDQAIFVDQLRSMGRMSARERIAYFLLDLAHRLRVTNRSMKNAFRLPLTQTEIGDATGLTSVTVSKTLMQLQLDKVIDRREGKIILLDEPALCAMSDYIDRYAEIDTSWFPEKHA